ncbi:MAG TPA: dolichyl-phosphate beta-glucosyltransferase [Terriglobales bacterium]
MPQYSIIIPAYNESARLGSTLDRVLGYVSAQSWDAEVIVVDDGSRDNTADMVREYAQSHPRLRLLQNPGNRGKGYSVRNGMLNATGNVLLFSDADLSAPIEEAPRLFSAIASGADIAIGSRWLQPEMQTHRQSLLRQFYGRLFNLALRLVLGLNFKDTQCGFKAFTRDAARQVFPQQQIERWGFDPELLYLARRAGLKVEEVAVHWAHVEGTRISPLRDGVRMFEEVLRIRWNAITGKYSNPQAAAPAAR